MSLTARLRGLEARIEWLEDWGELRKLARQIRVLAAKKKIIKRAPELAVRLGLMPPPLRRVAPPAPPPPRQESPHREVPTRSDVLEVNPAWPLDSHEMIRAPGGAMESGQREEPSAPWDASLHDAPRHEVVPRPPPAVSPPESPVAPEQPAEQLPEQPFVPIQDGLVRWRHRGPEDDWDDDETDEGEDYDPFADDA